MAQGTHTLTAERLFDGREMHGPTRVTVENGVVTRMDPHTDRCEHHLLAPGLVDLQVNGWSDVDFSSSDAGALTRVDTELAAMGTTSYLATLVTDSLDRLSSRIDFLTSMMPSLPGMAGIHLEGPFLGRSPGAHRHDRIVDIDLDWLSSLPSSVRLVTVGAEQQNFVEATALLASMGMSVSIGHSVPTEHEYESAVAAGARMCTHLFNAMSGVHHREFGLALAALTDDRIAAGLIADLRHVSPRAVALAFRARPDGLVLVSDSVGWQTERGTMRGVRLQDGAPRLPDGTLAGSSTHLADCVSHAVNAGGAALEAALKAATSTPASVIAEDGAGTIDVGMPADIVAFAADLRVVRTWRRLVSSRGTPTDN